MIKLLIKFWPILIPLGLFALWYMTAGKKRRAVESREVTSALEAKLWNWTLLISLMVGVGCLLWVGLSSESNTDATYVPPKYENGQVIPGHMIEGH